MWRVVNHICQYFPLFASISRYFPVNANGMANMLICRHFANLVSGEPMAKLPEGCRKLYNFCCLRQCFGKGHKNITASGEVLRTFSKLCGEGFLRSNLTISMQQDFLFVSMLRFKRVQLDCRYTAQPVSRFAMAFCCFPWNL